MSKGTPSLNESLTNIQWLCNLESAELLTNDKRKKGWNNHETTSTFTKPPYSYATLILMAINSSEEKRMTLQDIYKWIQTKYPFYKTCKKSWKNSIRHNLSLYNFFIKEKRPSTCPGKGSYWSISPEGKENMMKNVLKNQQPTINSLEYFQGQSKGLRPILPKPKHSTGSDRDPTIGVQIVGDGSVPGLPRRIPIVILPTDMYVSMANKLAAQTATGNTTDTKPSQFLTSMEASVSGLQSTPSSTKNLDARSEMVTKIEDGTPSTIYTTCSGSRDCEHVESLQMGQEFALPIMVLPESLKGQVTSSSHNPSTSGFDSGIDCSVSEVDSSSDYTCKAKKRQKGIRKFEEPSAKRVRQRKQKKPIVTSSSTLSTPTEHNEKYPSKRSPLRECSQPTLAAINSNSNMSPSNILKTFIGDEISPLPATPTKDYSRNPLTAGFVSPTNSAVLGYNYCPQAFTPLRFDSESGLFTPLADGGFDSGFLVSPASRYSSAWTPNKLSSTPHSCRKSLRLGGVKEDVQGNGCFDWFQTL